MRKPTSSGLLSSSYFSPFFLQLLLATKYFVVLVRIGALFMMRGSPDKRKPNQQAGGQAIYHKRGFMVFVVLVFFLVFCNFIGFIGFYRLLYDPSR